MINVLQISQATVKIVINFVKKFEIKSISCMIELIKYTNKWKFQEKSIIVIEFISFD